MFHRSKNQISGGRDMNRGWTSVMMILCVSFIMWAGTVSVHAQFGGGAQPAGTQSVPNWALAPESPAGGGAIPSEVAPPPNQYDSSQDYGTSPEGGVSKSTKIILWVAIGIVLLLLHIFIAIFIAMDGKRRNIGGAAGWAVFGAVPVLGLIGLFAYVLSAQPKLKEPDNELLRRVFEEGQKRAQAALEPQIRDLQAQKQQMEQEMQRAPFQEEMVTDIIKLEQGRPDIQLKFVTGDKMGETVALVVRDPIRGTPKKVKIGRDAKSGGQITLPWDSSVSNPHCELSFDEEGYYVFDLNSGNGTLLKKHGSEDWKKVFGKMHIQDRDRLKLGKTVLQVDITDPEKDILPGDEKGYASDLDKGK